MLYEIIDWTTIVLTVVPFAGMFVWLVWPQRRIRVRSVEDGHRGVVDVRSKDGQEYRCYNGVCKLLPPYYEEPSSYYIQVEK